MTLVILPIAVIHTDIKVNLLANAALFTLCPLALVSNGCLFSVTFAVVLKDALAVTKL